MFSGCRKEDIVGAIYNTLKPSGLDTEIPGFKRPDYFRKNIRRAVDWAFKRVKHDPHHQMQLERGGHLGLDTTAEIFNQLHGIVSSSKKQDKGIVMRTHMTQRVLHAAEMRLIILGF